MNWQNSLRDQLPLLVALSPVIGFFAAYVASKFQRDLIRPLAISNSLCTLLILAGVAWQVESDSLQEANLLRQSEIQASTSSSSHDLRQAAYEQIDRQRVDRVRRLFFVIDGTNLWPVFVLIVLTGLMIWKAGRTVETEPDFVPVILLFESATIAALTAYDVRGFLLASGISAMLMSVLIGRWGGLDRRGLSGRFLFAQLCGNGLIMFGFAMLVVAVPWLKLDVSSTLSPLSWNIATIAYEVQKWTARNELAFQYQSEVFPWILLILSVGFAIQFGLFPFHVWQASLLSNTSPGIAVLCLAGSIPISSIGWLRFVVPLAPDLLAQFDWLMLIPSAGGAIWGAARALAASTRKEQTSFLFVSLSGFSLLGVFSFTTIGLSGAWLMQQQLILIYSLTLFAVDSPLVMTTAGLSGDDPWPTRFSTRARLLFLSIPTLGLFATSAMILPQLLRESLLLVAIVFTVVLFLCTTLLVLLNRYFAETTNEVSEVFPPSAAETQSQDWAMVLILVLAIITNCVPSVMLHQCEPEFDRVFHRFERF